MSNNLDSFFQPRDFKVDVQKDSFPFEYSNAIKGMTRQTRLNSEAVFGLLFFLLNFYFQNVDNHFFHCE